MVILGCSATICVRIYVTRTLCKYKFKKTRLKLCTDSGGKNNKTFLTRRQIYTGLLTAVNNNNVHRNKADSCENLIPEVPRVLR